MERRNDGRKYSGGIRAEDFLWRVETREAAMASCSPQSAKQNLRAMISSPRPARRWRTL
jgi:hypothetical protein